MTTTPLPPLPAHFASSSEHLQNDVRNYATQARADLEDEVARLRKIAWLIGSIFVHGNFKAETYNERELEKMLRENGTFWESLADFEARAALKSKP